MFTTRDAPAARLAMILSALAAATGAWAAPAPAPAVPATGADSPSPPPVPAPLDIRPNPSAKWEAQIPDVEKVLRFAAAELWPYFPDRKLSPILVEPKGGPIVLFQRGPKGEYQVRLNTGGLLWAQYTYQFAHEFCHILCEYDEDENPCKWFEESLCELASLFVLRRSAETWKTKPPYPHWKDFAPHLTAYADQRITEAPLPPGRTLAAYYRENAEAFAKNATDRPKNTVVAVQLLPLFEKSPERWAAVGWLNREKLDKTYDFTRYLAAWHRNVPEKHRAFVREVAKQFEIEIHP
jgi:hypothetical protein